MAKEIDKIIQSKTAPKSNNVLWDDGENLKINRNGKWESAGGGAPMINITYANLVELRNNSKLIAGMQYRITDYVTTTAQENTRSAGHQFDVIVTADNKNTLNEVARACLHEGDTYFTEAGANLAAWKIWYSLDNDTKRFAWASNEDYIVNEDGNKYVRYPSLDKTNNGTPYYAWYNDDENIFVYTELPYAEGGEIVYDNDFYEDWYIQEVISKGTGVIYRMIDEWNNDVPYDFKNIQFKRNLTFENKYAEYSEDGEETWVYTFAGQSYHIDNDEWSEMLDGSLESPYGHMSDESTSTFHDNSIKPYIMLYDDKNEVYTECGIKYLNDIVFLGYWDKIGSANDEDIPYYYANCCYSNTLENNCHNNNLGNNCYNNNLGNDCRFNTLGNYCYDNNFGNGCYDNNFDNNCFNNSLANYCNNLALEVSTINKIISKDSNHEFKVFNLADLADLLN